MKRKKFFCSFICLCFLCGLFSLNVFAYSYLEARLSAPYATYTYQSGSNNFNNAVTLSASRWTSLSEAAFSHISSGGQVFITEGNSGAVSWDGMTNYTSFSGGFAKTASVRINSYYTNSYTSYQVQSVVAHELGHVLGLGDESKRVLMWPITETRATNGSLIFQPTSYDCAAVSALY